MKKINLCLLIVISLFGSIFAQENYSQWAASRAYILNTSSSGANVTGDVTKFPVLVSLGNADSAIFTGAKSDGTDIRFTKMDGTRLPHQIENWNSAGRSATLWVLLDTIKGSNSTQMVKMLWGKADAADSSKGSAVFDTANGYVAVWHMAGSGDVTDATVNGLVATAAGTPGSATGAIGPGRTFNGTDQYFTVADNAVLNFTAPALTLSLWVNATAWTASTALIRKGGVGTTANASQYGLRDNSSNALAIEINGNHHASSNNYLDSRTNAWYLVQGQYDGTNVRVFVNGAQVFQGNRTGNLATTAHDMHIGRRADNANLLTGSLDEIRVQKIVRSTNWLSLEYENQKAAQSLLQPAPAPSALSYLADPANYVANLMITPNTATVTGTVDSFTISPVLPTGLVLNKTTGTISGTPTATSAATNYVVTAANASGSITDTISITVNAALPSAPTIAYAPTSATYNVGTAISSITPTLGGGAVDSITVAPALPAGLALNKSTGVISGTPTAVSAAASYIFTATNLGGSAMDTINFTVLPAVPSNLVYPVQTVTYVMGEAIVNNVPTVSGSVDSFTVVPALPAGLSFNKTTGTISGLPTATSAATNYIVSAQNAGGSTKDTVNITVSAGEVFSTWTGHRTIWLNTTANGANVAATVTNFPVLVRLTTTDSVFAQSKGLGADLRFTKTGDVIRLKHQIESWDSVGKTASIWVLLDSVKGANSTQTFRMHWNKTGAPSLSNGATVFDTARGFQAVWHFSEGNADTAFDATANAFRGAPQRSSGAVSFPSDTAGMVGRARYYGIGGGTVNSTGGYFSVPNSATGPLNFPENGTYTVSTWANVDMVGTSRTLFSKSDKAYSLELRNTGADWEFAEFSAGAGWNVVNQAGAVPQAWVHLVGVRNGPTSLLYVDGALIDAEVRLDASTAARRTVDFEIGRSPDGGTSNAARYYWRGMLDEVRLASVSRTADWAKLEYENQKTAQTLVWFTAPPVSIGSAAAARKNPVASLSVKSFPGGVRIGLSDLIDGNAVVTLSDMRGRAVWSGTFAPGVDLFWNGTDRNGQTASAGIYLARVKWIDASGKNSRVFNARVPFTR